MALSEFAWVKEDPELQTMLVKLSVLGEVDLKYSSYTDYFSAFIPEVGVKDFMQSPTLRYETSFHPTKVGAIKEYFKSMIEAEVIVIERLVRSRVYYKWDGADFTLLEVK